MQTLIRAALLSASILAFQPVYAYESPPPAPMVELEDGNKARSKYASLHKKLTRAREEFEKGNGRRLTNAVKTLMREVEAVRKKDPTLDLSAEEAEIKAYIALAEEMVAAETKAKAEERAFKNIDRAIAKVQRLVDQAKRSKPKEKQFLQAVEKAENEIAKALEAVPDLDVADSQAQIADLETQFAEAVVGAAHGVQFKVISKAMDGLRKELDRVEKSSNRLSGKAEDAIDEGADFWPEKVDEARAEVIAAFELAQSEQPDIDMSGVEAELAETDARIAALKQSHTKALLDIYFTDRIDELAAGTAQMRGNFENGSTYRDSDLARAKEGGDKIKSMIETAKDTYEDGDFSTHADRYASAIADFDSALADHKQRADAEQYYGTVAPLIQPLAYASENGLEYQEREILGGDLGTLDVANLRKRLAGDAGKGGMSRKDDAQEYLDKADSFMKGDGYITGVKAVLKRTNDTSLPLPERTTQAANAERIALIALKFHPEDPRYTNLVAETRSRKEAMAAEKAERYASASTGPFHLANMDSIVLHSAPLEIGNEDTSLIADTFEAGQPIYGTAYLSRPLREVSLRSGKPEIVEIDFRISGDYCGRTGQGYVSGLERDDLGQTYLQFTLLPDLSDYAYEPGDVAHLHLAECQALNATPGEQEVLVELSVQDSNSERTMSLGRTFKLAYDANSATRLAPIVEQLQTMQIDKTRMPEAVMSNPEFEALMIKAADSVDGDPIRAVLSTDHWNVEKNDYDIPLSQWLRGDVAVKTAEGRCFIYKTILTAKYVGGAYGAPYPEQIYSKPREIRCENVGE